MNIAFTLDYIGTADADDILAARRLVDIENTRRAALVPPGTPLSTLPVNLKASALTVFSATITAAWLSYIDQAKQDTTRFTPAQITQIIANLNARLNAGEAASSIVIDTAS